MNPRISPEVRVFGVGLAIVVPLAYFLRKWSDRQVASTVATSTPQPTSYDFGRGDRY